MASDEELTALPPFLRLAGHELRWQILRSLAQSDRRVRELVDILDQPQNLVSYHLGKLRNASLVDTRHSSADGRDIYYRLDLSRCAGLLAETSRALHPALGPTPAQAPIQPRRGRRSRVLFLCTGNSARSPMAAALLRHRTGGRVQAVSAGSHPKPLNHHAVHALDAYDIDLSGHRPRHVDSYAGQRFDYVISLCDRVREVCPQFATDSAYVHWSMADPAAEPETGDAAYRRTAAELDTRIGYLVPMLSAPRHLEMHR